jgi:hypothetical protein
MRKTAVSGSVYFCLKSSQKSNWSMCLVQLMNINFPAFFVETFRWHAFSDHQPDVREPPQFSSKYLKLP